jgi:TolA-binding protein
MEQNITESPAMFNLMGWFEKNKKQVVIGAVIVVVIGVVAASVISSKNEKAQYAGQALSKALLTPMLVKRMDPADTAAELLKVADANKGTTSAEQALLLAGGAYFNAGKFAESQQVFERFTRENPRSELLPQALYGSGAALSAQGKADDAAKSYLAIVDSHKESAVALQARYSLAGVFAGQGQLEKALALYEEVVRADIGTSLGNEAASRADELRAKLPAIIAPTPLAAGTNAPVAK